MDHLRHDIDSGRTGEKVAFPDPAAAPLGTDAEVGGHPPTASEVALDAASSGYRRNRNTLPGTAIYAVLAILVAAAILTAVATAGQ